VTVLDRPVAASWRPVHFVLTMLATVFAALLFAAGWTASKVVQAAVWCAAAVRLGWDDARAGGS
jgi:hypothetical protein